MPTSLRASASRCAPIRLLAALFLALAGALPLPVPVLAQTPRTITLATPAAGAAIGSPVEVLGRVTVSPFENTLVGTVVDAAGQTLGTGPVTVTPDAPGTFGGPGSFSARLSFTASAGGAGRVVVADVSQADGSVLASAGVDVVLPGGPPPAGGASWLDRSPPASWNVRNGSFPTPPPGAPGGDPQCLAQATTPTGPEESAVAGAGWRLFDAPLVGAATGGLKVVSGTAGYDGMCRPMDYQQFVFVDGGFVGTISPTPMGARADGSGSVRGPVGPDTLTAVFARYGADDPLCCPSRETAVTYRVDRSATPLLLVPTGATTGAPGTTTPPAAPGQGSAPADLAPGTVVALRGTPHLWIAGTDGALHWFGDTRALAGQPADWGSRVEVDAPTLRAARRGDPFLSAGLVRRGGPIFLAKWEQGQAQPTLLHIQTIADLTLFGITGDNYGRFVLEEPAWNQRYGFTAAALPTGELQPAS
jgi:hypothetical protein